MFKESITDLSIAINLNKECLDVSIIINTNILHF
jgi:tetratricopeptide (TPR) repeat protein